MACFGNLGWVVWAAQIGRAPASEILEGTMQNAAGQKIMRAKPPMCQHVREPNALGFWGDTLGHVVAGCQNAQRQTILNPA